MKIKHANYYTIGPFPASNFIIDGFAPPFRLDRTGHGDGILLYVRKDIPSKKIIFTEILVDLEIIFVEIMIHTTKWHIGNFYNPNKNQISTQVSLLGKYLGHYLPSYDNVLLLGDFNSEMTENAMIDFCEIYNLKNEVKDPTCFKNVENPSCIDLISTNRLELPKNSSSTGLSDYHKILITVLKSYFKKKRPKIVLYRDYKDFSNTNFIEYLNSILISHDTNNIGYDVFQQIIMNLLDEFVPIKRKYIRANEGPFMNKELRKTVTHRSRSNNKFYNEKSELSKPAYIGSKHISHELLIAYSYLSNGYQRVSAEYSSWSEINFEIPQGSILGPLLFNIYLSDLFLLLSVLTPYATARNTELVIDKPESDSKILFQWLSFNFLKANPEKSHLLLKSTDNSLFPLIL